MEGPNGLGKSATARALSRETGWPYYDDPNSPDVASLSADYFKGHDYGSLCMAVQTGADVILDRSFPSQVVYSRLYGRQYDVWSCSDLEEILSEVPYACIMASSKQSPEDALMMLHRRGVDLPMSEPEWIRSTIEYNRYLLDSKLVWHFAYAENQIYSNVEEILKIARS